MSYAFRPLRVAGIAPQGAQGPVKTTMENLLTHVPGEASGFYLLGLEMMRPAPPDRFDPFELGVLFVLALALLVLVRKLAGASTVLIVTSAIAFGLWMTVFKDGFFYQALNRAFGLEDVRLLLVISAFFTGAVTALANAGKIK